MSLQKLITDINAAADAPVSELTDKERSEILSAADRLRTAYERPFEVALRILLGVSTNSSSTEPESSSR